MGLPRRYAMAASVLALSVWTMRLFESGETVGPSYAGGSTEGASVSESVSLLLFPSLPDSPASSICRLWCCFFFHSVKSSLVWNT